MILRPAARAAHTLTICAVLVGGLAVGQRSAAPPLSGGEPSITSSSAVGVTGTATVVAGPRHRVRYHGVSVQVPSTWPVVDLDADPTACVRMDRPAVYLGAAGGQQQCPARVVGGADTVWLAP
ncbi:MAG: hypothetical protein ABI131_11685, partial [Nostocoides sp.]